MPLAHAAALESLARSGDAGLRAVGRKLVDSLRNPTVVRDPAALAAFPVQPRGVREAIARALVNEDEAFARDALVGCRLLRRADAALRRRPSRHPPRRQPQGVRSGAARQRPSRRSGASAATPAGTTATRSGACAASRPARRRSWAAPRRRRADELNPGDPLDFWRVESVEPDRLLRLRAEMKVPGRAWLQFETDAGPGRHRDPADRDLRRLRTLRAGLLVRPLPSPPLHLRRHAPRHCRPRSGVGRLTRPLA